MPRATAAHRLAWPPAPPTPPAQTSEHEFVVGPGAGALTVCVEPEAAITVSAWDEDRVLVRARFEGGAGARGRLEASWCTGGGPTRVRVHVYGARGAAGPCAAQLDVRVPRHFDVALYAPESAVIVAGVEGAVTGRTRHGALSLGSTPPAGTRE